MSTVLEAKGVSRVFPSKQGTDALTVLDSVDVAIQDGTSVAIVGASGSGKSTLLHVLGGLDKPSSGSVFFNGSDLTKLNADELAAFRNTNLGFVFQFHHLLPEFTALENVYMPGLIKGTEFKILKEKATGLLTSIGLGDRLNHRPSELSGGEQQRVAVARALINDPDVILADEPTGNLDENSTRSLLEILFPLVKNQNLTLVLVTHDMNIANSCDIVYRLERGKLA